MRHFEGFVGKQVYLATPRTKYIGTVEHEDDFFIYLTDCIVLPKAKPKKKSPYATIRKREVLEMRVIGDGFNGYSET